MLSALITLVIYLIIAGLLYWAVTAVIGLLPLPSPIPQIVQIILILIICLMVVYALFGLLPHGGPILLR